MYLDIGEGYNMRYKEAAELLGYTIRYVKTLVKTGKLGSPSIKYRITQEDINNYEHPTMGRPYSVESRSSRSKLPSVQIIKQMMREGWTAKEIAEENNVTPDAVFKRLAKTRKEAEND